MNTTKEHTMKTIRVFIVEVSGCYQCLHQAATRCYFTAKEKDAIRCVLHDQNYNQITPTCPRYAETKLIEVKE